MSPTLEPHHAELVDCMLDQLSQMTENLKKCQKNDFRVAIHKLEVCNLKFMYNIFAANVSPVIHLASLITIRISMAAILKEIYIIV